jgi:hypothetical protein
VLGYPECIPEAICFDALHGMVVGARAMDSEGTGDGLGIKSANWTELAFIINGSSGFPSSLTRALQIGRFLEDSSERT